LQLLSRRELFGYRADDLPGFHTCEISRLAAGMRVEAGRASPEVWADIVQNFGDANLYQTWPYSSARWGERRLGHVVLKEGNQIVAAAQVIFLKLPFSFGGLAYVKWGPLWNVRGATVDLYVLRNMLIALRAIYAHHGRMLLRVTPWEFEDSEQWAIIHDAGFKSNPSAEQLRTATLNLSHSMDELRTSLSRHWRYNLKLAEKNELDVREGFTDELMEDFATLYEDMRGRKGRENIPPMEYLPQVQRELPAALKLRIAICRRAGVPIAGLVVSAMGTKAFALAAATGSEGMEFRGSYLLQWRMIQWLKGLGVRCYDLARINEKTHPGTTQFKLGLAGKLGSTVGYLGEFHAYDNRASHVIVSSAERLWAMRSKLWSAVNHRARPWSEAS
jgi:peptidoglycan pentaglycine glycine transferase (the first glycine)